MRKDDCGVGECAKHMRNTAYGKRGINKRNRLNTSKKLRNISNKSKRSGRSDV